MSIFTNDIVIDGGTVTVDTITNAVTVTGTVTANVGSGTQPISGSVSVSNFPATQPISGSVSVSNFPATQPVSIAGTVNVLTAVAATATISQISLPNTTDTLLLASNANRKSAIIFIPKTGIFVKYGAGASATSFTYKTNATNSTIIVTGYTGQINGFGPSDTINVTEL